MTNQPTEWPCYCCDKPIKELEKAGWVRTWYGSDLVTPEQVEELSKSHPGGDTGFYPVGRGCLKKNQELRENVKIWKGHPLS